MIDYNDAYAESLAYFNSNELAASTFLGKYALKDKQGKLLESNPDQMHHRLAREFARIEAKYPNPLTEEEIYQHFRKFTKLIPQGSPMAGIGNPYQHMSLANCLALDPPYDSVAGICQTDQELAQASKRRAGVGFDISSLRPKGIPVANAAKTTDGIGVFMERFSETCRGIAQNGRRGALLLMCSCHHPEVETFINIKRDLKKVTGANISVQFTDEFMTAVENNTEYEQRWPVDSLSPVLSKMVNARSVWNKFVDSAWACAEPGALFWDTVIRNSPSDAYADQGFKTVGTNACSELPLNGNGTCILLLLNLMGFVRSPFTKEASFDHESFQQAAKVGQRLLDDMVDLELECLDKIIGKIVADPEPPEVKQIELGLWNKIKKSTERGRRTGLGTTAVGDMLASLGMTYGSADSVRFIDELYKELAVASYGSSVEMAGERGAFPIFSHAAEKNNVFIRRVLEAMPEPMLLAYQTQGRRNIANLTIPPSGTTALLACLSEKDGLFGTTSGIEPAYMLAYKRRKKVSSTDDRVDFVDALGDKWQEFMVYHSGYGLWAQAHGLTAETVKPEDSPYWKATAGDLDWTRSVDIQTAAQRWICHSISKTCGLPADATKELVSSAYMKAWKQGAKGFTIYRDGSRAGVLVSVEDKTTESFKQYDAPKRPHELPCDIYQVTVAGEKWTLFVSLLENKPFEVLGGLSKYVKIPRRVTKGKIVKNNGVIVPARYDLHYDFDKPENEAIIQDVGNVFENPTHSGFTRLVSLSLRHGTPVQYVVEQMSKTADERGEDINSLCRALARVLKKYTKDSDYKIKNTTCPECGKEESLAHTGGCVQCTNCSWEKCA